MTNSTSQPISLREIGHFYGGLTGKSGKDFGRGNSKYITFMNVINNVIAKSDLTDYVEIKDGERQNKVSKGDLLFNGSSETPEEVAFPSLVTRDLEGLYLNSFCFGFRFEKSDIVDPLFFAYYLRSNYGRQFMSQLAQGSTRYNISKRALLDIEWNIPKIKEQIAIAEALSDIDELISITKNAISKTENTKQSILYPLLTGKNSKSNVANWQQQPLGEILEYEQPTKYLVNTNKHKDSGKYPVLTAGKTFILGYTDDEYGVYAKEEVILFDDFTTEKKYVDFPFKVKSSACKMLTSRTDAINLRFVFEAMKLLKFQPYDHKRYWISEYSKLVLPLPEKNEQDSIAEVIKDFDLKLSLLKSELEKYEWLKQGMMHELLSGNVRLV